MSQNSHLLELELVNHAPKAAKFEGWCEELIGHIYYDYANPRQAADQFTKMMTSECAHI
jgi:hypothetical protein